MPAGLPLVSDHEIAFNGGGSDAGEWFVLRASPSAFECVKTYRRPYDLVVAAVLVIAKHRAPSEILNVTNDSETSDNWADAWSPALQLCAAANVAISPTSIALLRADVARESKPYEAPRSDEEVESDTEWERTCEEHLLKAFCEERVSPRYLRYQAAFRTMMWGVKLQLRRSIDARSLSPTSPALREKANELQIAWNQTHRIQIVTVEIS